MVPVPSGWATKGADMEDMKARVIVTVLGSAGTVLTLASVLGAGKKWSNN